MLTTLDDVKRWLNLPAGSNADDALLTRLIVAASAFVESWLGRRLLLQDCRERRTGHGRDTLLLAHYPVAELLAVEVDGLPLPLSGLLADGRHLTLARGTFARGSTVTLHYRAGYATVPPDIEQAVLDLVALRYRERDRIGHQSKSLAGETVSFFIGELTPAARAALINYKDVVPL